MWLFAAKEHLDKIQWLAAEIITGRKMSFDLQMR